MLSNKREMIKTKEFSTKTAKQFSEARVNTCGSEIDSVNVNRTELALVLTDRLTVV